MQWKETEKRTSLCHDANNYFERARNSDLWRLKVESVDFLAACIAHEQR